MPDQPTNVASLTDGMTLSEALDRFQEAGFRSQFAARENATIECFSCHTTSPADSVELAALIRTEGASDPDDMIAVAALRCPRCGARGTVALKFGPAATSP